MASLARYIRLLRLFARNNFVRELEFRANFFAKLVTNVLWLAGFLLVLKIIFANTNSVAGWSEAEAFLLFGTFYQARAIMDIFFTPNMSKIPELIRMGTMDFALTKPVSAQFFATMRFQNLDEIGSYLGAWGVILYALSLQKAAPSPAQFVAWLYLILCGVAVLYALNLFLMTLSFWLVRVDNISALVDSVVYVSRYPPDIFGKPLIFVFTYLLPLVFIAAVPTLALKNGVDVGSVFLATTIALLFCGGATLFWRFATRSYTSASS